MKVDPNEFQKKGVGTGGMLVTRNIGDTDASSSSPLDGSRRFAKTEKFPAFCARSNPPNTELRRYYQILVAMSLFTV
jgi:hypothetical protein